MAPQLRALTILPGDPGSIPSTPSEANSMPGYSVHLLASVGTALMLYTHQSSQPYTKTKISLQKYFFKTTCYILNMYFLITSNS